MSQLVMPVSTKSTLFARDVFRRKYDVERQEPNRYRRAVFYFNKYLLITSSRYPRVARAHGAPGFVLYTVNDTRRDDSINEIRLFITRI